MNFVLKNELGSFFSRFIVFASMSNRYPEEKHVSFSIPSPDFLKDVPFGTNAEPDFFRNYAPNPSPFQPLPSFDQYHHDSSSVSSVVDSLPHSSQSFACPPYTSNYFYDHPPRHYPPHDQYHEPPKYHPMPNVSGSPPLQPRMSGRNSAPPRILSEPRYPISQPFYAPTPVPRCSTPALPIFANSHNHSPTHSHRNSGAFSNFVPGGTQNVEVSQTSSPTLTENESQVIYKEMCNPFTQRIICFFSSDGGVPIVCDICKSTTTLEVCKGKNAQMACGHYIACNECRGRTVRRLLRCVSCCKELTSSFPVCGDSCVDVTSNKEPSNTGSCPRCDKKLRREVCGTSCDRRKRDEYLELRNQLNDKVAIMVLNPTDCLNYSHNGIWRPCSHFSYCAEHHVICKGHGKDITCRFCKGNKKMEKRRASLDLRPSKRRCVRRQ